MSNRVKQVAVDSIDWYLHSPVLHFSYNAVIIIKLATGLFWVHYWLTQATNSHLAKQS